MLEKEVAPEDILALLEKEYLAVLQSPSLLHFHRFTPETSKEENTLSGDLLSQGEAMQDVCLLDMIEGEMSIQDVEKRLSRLDHNLLPDHLPQEDVLAMYSPLETIHPVEASMATISHQNHRNPTLHTRVRFTVAAPVTAEKERYETS